MEIFIATEVLSLRFNNLSPCQVKGGKVGGPEKKSSCSWRSGVNDCRRRFDHNLNFSRRHPAIASPQHCIILLYVKKSMNETIFLIIVHFFHIGFSCKVFPYFSRKETNFHAHFVTIFHTRVIISQGWFFVFLH